ncbi:MAG: M24 family metallopeptidase [Candidatus Nanoarchaeia archaeon]
MQPHKDLVEVNQFTAKLHEKSKSLIVEGVKSSEIINTIEKEIFEHNYLPSFPAMLAINEVAAHWTSFEEDDYILKKGDIVSVDFGASKDGYIADMAYSIVVGGFDAIEDKEERKHIENLFVANQKALESAVNVSNVGVTIGEIGKAVYDTAKEYGCNTIHNLSGHQIARNKLHAGVNVSNFDNHDMTTINPNTHLAIEPFLTYGEPKIIERGVSHILHLQSTKPTRDIIAKQVLDVIKKHFPHLPFSKRWLLEGVEEELGEDVVKWKTFSKQKLLRAVQSLKQSGHILEYGQLVSKSGDIISQFEHSVWYGEDESEKVVLTELKK